MGLKIKITERESGIFIVLLKGSIDSSTYEEMEAAIRPVLTPSTKAIVLNMGEVDYITSMGIKVVMDTKKAVGEQRGIFMMIDLQPQVKNVFEIVKLYPTLNIFENIEEADRYLLELQKKEIERRKRELK